MLMNDLLFHVTVFSQLSSGSQLHSDPLDGAGAVEVPRAPLSLVQSLAAARLGTLSQSPTATTFSNTDNRYCSLADLDLSKSSTRLSGFKLEDLGPEIVTSLKYFVGNRALLW